MALPASLASAGRISGRLAWRPAKGPGARRLTVTLMSNHRSVDIAIKRVSHVLAELPRAVFTPISHNALARAKELSSGGFTRNAQEAFTRQHGYGPYSLKRPAQANDYIINKQTGKLLRGWRRRATSGTGTTEMEIAIYNIARSKGGFNYPLALFTGTRLMRERQLPQKVYEQAAEELDRELAKWRMRILRGWTRSKGRVTKNG